MAGGLRPAGQRPSEPASETRVSTPGLSDVVDTVPGMAHLHGDARVSTAGQDAALQDEALRSAGCARVWTDVASGARHDRPELGKVLEQLLPGDTLVAWRLDRFGRSLRHPVETVIALGERGSGSAP